MPPAALESAPAPPARQRGWFRAFGIVFGVALVAAVGLRVFVAEAFRIPTPSMEETLLVGDFLLVSKLDYGPRLPVTLSVPFSDQYVAVREGAPVRLPGLRPVRRGDVVVFNLPPERRPVDRKTPYVKRVIGLPGDTVEIEGKQLRVGGREWPLEARQRQYWVAHLDTAYAIGDAELAAAGVRGGEWLGRRRLRFSGTPGEARAVGAQNGVARVAPYVTERWGGLFPPNAPFSADYYGPIVVPAAGRVVRLNDQVWPAVAATAERYEGRTMERFGPGVYRIDGELTDTLAFRQDYYFVLGDNRDDSSDSRVWGFVPASHVIGRAAWIYFSRDPESGRVRWGRLFQPIE